MPKLRMNAAFNIQFEGDFNANGTPRQIAKIVHSTEPARFSQNVDTIREMVDAWNEKHGTDKP